MNIIERIKKLYNLSTRNSSTEEAASAAAKIQELCFEHNLELEKIVAQGTDPKEPYVEFDYLMPETTRTDVGWKRSLFSAICEANFCESVYFTNTTKMAVVGQKHNFEVVVYMFEYLMKEINRLAVEESRKRGFFSNKERRRYMQGFCEGARVAVCRKLLAKKQEQTRSSVESRELVVVKDGELDRAVKNIWPRLHHASPRAATGSRLGYSDGSVNGAGIALNRGVNSGRGEALITK